MLRLLNVATPATAATVVVPDSVPLPGFTAIAIATLLEKLVMVFPWASCAVTLMAGVTAAPAVVLDGCTVMTSFVAAAGVMSKAVLVMVGRPVVLAFSV